MPKSEEAPQPPKKTGKNSAHDKVLGGELVAAEQVDAVSESELPKIRPDVGDAARKRRRERAAPPAPPQSEPVPKKPPAKSKF